MARSLIGRERERRLLGQVLASREAAFLALYGRRRVGKTFLIREVLKEELCFELTGMRGGSLREQLANFSLELGRASRGKFPRSALPASWQEAFHEFEAWFETLPRDRKRVVFLDELPWLAGARSRFMSALDHFWNSWGTKQDNLILVVSGSATSWMNRELFHAKGGLHNRVTHRIRLEPFDLGQSREFLRSLGVDLTDRQVVELYMAFGGVPLYLDQAARGESAAQIIDRVCFDRNGLLHDELSMLYPALFDSPERHLHIIRSLAAKRAGLTHQQIAAAIRQSPSGRLTAILEELEQCGFVQSAPPYGKRSRETLYRLADEYSLFYLKWIESHRGNAKGAWLSQRNSPKWRAWSGYAFENLCMKHIGQIKAALGIAGISTEIASWQHHADDANQTGGQIDLLIVRADGCINLCEMKFSDDEFIIDKRYAETLRKRREMFRRVTKSRMNLFLTFVTSVGLKKNAYALDLVSSSVTMEVLFAPGNQ